MIVPLSTQGKLRARAIVRALILSGAAVGAMPPPEPEPEPAPRRQCPKSRSGVHAYGAGFLQGRRCVYCLAVRP